MTGAWPAQRLGRVAKTVGGTGFPHDQQGNESGELPFVKVSDLKLARNAAGVVSAANYVSRETARSLGARVVPPGAVVFPKVGAALLGNARALTLAPCLIDNNMMAVIPVEGDSRFWKYVLSILDLGRLSGSGPLPFVSESQVRDLRVPFPQTETQRRIAAFLDAETARIDQLDSFRCRQLQLLNELSSTSISAAFNLGATVPDVRLGYLARIQTGITVDASRPRTEGDSARPYLRVANVQAGHVDLSDVATITVPEAMATSATLRPGDVLMTEGGDLDKLGRGTVWHGQIDGCLHQNHVFAVRVDKRRLAPEYLAFLTQTINARIHFESTGNKTTNLASTSSSKIRDLRVPLPPLTQQLEIVEAAKAMLAKRATLTESIARQRQLLAERRQALITAAVTGQFDVATGRGVDLT